MISFKQYDDTELKELIVRNKKTIEELQLEIEKLRTHVISLRGLVNRKLGDAVASPNNSKKETNKNIDGLDELRCYQ